jgi:activator of 2-hydroxyglutaryl-CoA dehydratase
VGTTGSGRHLAAVLIGADVVKNEITAHAVAAATFYPEVRTIMRSAGRIQKLLFCEMES